MNGSCCGRSGRLVRGTERYAICGPKCKPTTSGLRSSNGDHYTERFTLFLSIVNICVYVSPFRGPERGKNENGVSLEGLSSGGPGIH